MQDQKQVAERTRTHDVHVASDVTFESFFLSKPVFDGLTDAGFIKPSPIQTKSLPIIKTGKSAIIQAKSGTGKTLVFAISALEKLKENLLAPQILILSPTREIADQSYHVINQIGKFKKNLYCKLFIGGLSFANDVQNLSPCNIVVGTPGRIIQLIEDGFLLTEHLSMFVLDEVDKILQEGLMKEVTLKIKSLLPADIQVLAVSATYTPEMLSTLDSLIPDAPKIMLDSQNPTLEGVKQYFSPVPEDKTKSIVHAFHWKTGELFNILSKVSFYQCIVFCNSYSRALRLVENLNTKGWPTRMISSKLTQTERLQVVSELRDFKLRVLVSSDLISRGVDFDRINLVINLDMPLDAETYLHRIGRTGRYGTLGVAVSLVSPEEKKLLDNFISKYDSPIQALPETIPPGFYQYELSEEDKTNMKTLEIEHAKQQLEITQAKQRTKRKAEDRKTVRKQVKSNEKEWETHFYEEDEQDNTENDDNSDGSETAQRSNETTRRKRRCLVKLPEPPPPPHSFDNPTEYIYYISSIYLPYIESQYR